jgi:hypothetical protein
MTPDPPHTTGKGPPKPDPSDRLLVVELAYAEILARVYAWEAEFGLTRLELVGCVQRAALELTGPLVERERKRAGEAGTARRQTAARRPSPGARTPCGGRATQPTAGVLGSAGGPGGPVGDSSRLTAAG